MRCRASVRCWCLGQCPVAGNSSVGFYECNLGAGYTIHPLQAAHGHFPSVLTLWVILIRVTQWAEDMGSGKGTLLGCPQCSHIWVLASTNGSPLISPGLSMASHSLLDLPTGFFFFFKEGRLKNYCFFSACRKGLEAARGAPKTTSA